MERRERATRALGRVAAALGPHGQWPGWVEPDGAPGSGRRDLAAPLTALGVLALRGLSVAGADAIVERSLEHVERTVRPGGLWRYYANIPPDTDDTAMCALALGLDHPVVREQTVASLAATRGVDGRFPTWLEAGWSPVFDPVPNAHVVAVLGPGPVTDAAVEWLLDVVAAGREAAESAYYPDPLDLHVALTRAVGAGVEALRPAVERGAGRAVERLHAGELSPYRIAQAVVVAASASRPDRRLLREAAGRLVELAGPDGSWPSDQLFVARNTAGPGLWRYRSWTVVTALCVRALAVAETGQEEAG